MTATQAPTPGPLSGDDVNRECKACGAFKPDLNAACTFCGLAPTAPVEASGSERERLISVMRDHIALGEIGSCSAEIVGHEEAADAILALRPQPSGETREAGWISDDDMRSLLECKDVGQGRAKLQLILNALSARPLALGGQHGVPQKWVEVARYATERGLTVHESNMRMEEFRRVVTPTAVLSVAADEEVK